MCEFCTKHGEGKIWYKNAANYAQDLLSDLNRRRYIENFLTTAFGEGFQTLGRLETIYRKKGKLPRAVAKAMVEKAKAEHFGQVLPIEEIDEVVNSARTVVRMPCACRWNIGKKEERCCYAVSYGPEAWYRSIDMGYFGKASDEGLESLTPDAAVAQMREMEEQGRVHTIWTMMTPFIGAICNCRPEDCLAMLTLSRTTVETMERAEQVARVEDALCTGCGLCDSECHFRAISSHNHAGASHAHIDPQKCFGCGLCRRACVPGAITLVPRQGAGQR
ncbi:MAG TPA: 4Fe-4S dicluster domain-containing protein [Nitrospirota bacterium]|nr:4Fe-4S dicluster domain-containing protein [Nitrospirota bacterium]